MKDGLSEIIKSIAIRQQKYASGVENIGYMYTRFNVSKNFTLNINLNQKT